MNGLIRQSAYPSSKRNILVHGKQKRYTIVDIAVLHPMRNHATIWFEVDWVET